MAVLHRLGEPPGTELSLGWRPRRHACCGPTPPRSKRYGDGAMAALRLSGSNDVEDSEDFPVTHWMPLPEPP